MEALRDPRCANLAGTLPLNGSGRNDAVERRLVCTWRVGKGPADSSRTCPTSCAFPPAILGARSRRRMYSRLCGLWVVAWLSMAWYGLVDGGKVRYGEMVPIGSGALHCPRCRGTFCPGDAHEFLLVVDARLSSRLEPCASHWSPGAGAVRVKHCQWLA